MALGAGILFHNRYRLIKSLGRGAFGEVWLANDEIMNVEVAVKIYVTLDDEGVDDFKIEYRNAFALHHSNLLHINHFDVYDNRPYLVMPYCPNGSANKLIGNIDEYTAWRFIHDVADGLSYLHRQNPPLIHQDIKPANILMDTDGQFLITDFGISKKIRTTMSDRGASAGTIAYMGPERFDKKAIPIKASDIWALGASIYYMLDNYLPFGENGGIIQKAGQEIPEIEFPCSDDLKNTIYACLAPNTWDRPTAEELAKYSNAYLNGIKQEPLWLKRTTPTKEIIPTKKFTTPNTPTPNNFTQKKSNNNSVNNNNTQLPNNQTPNFAKKTLENDPKPPKKKYILIGSIILLLIFAGVGGALLFSKGKSIEEEITEAINRGDTIVFDESEGVTKIVTKEEKKEIEKKNKEIKEKKKNEEKKKEKKPGNKPEAKTDDPEDQNGESDATTGTELTNVKVIDQGEIKVSGNSDGTETTPKTEVKTEKLTGWKKSQVDGLNKAKQAFPKFTELINKQIEGVKTSDNEAKWSSIVQNWMYRFAAKNKLLKLKDRASAFENTKTAYNNILNELDTNEKFDRSAIGKRINNLENAISKAEEKAEKSKGIIMMR